MKVLMLTVIMINLLFCVSNKIRKCIFGDSFLMMHMERFILLILFIETINIRIPSDPIFLNRRTISQIFKILTVFIDMMVMFNRFEIFIVLNRR